VDIIRTVYYIRELELMKLIFAVLDVSLTMGLTRCYKTEGFLHLFCYNVDKCCHLGNKFIIIARMEFVHF